MREKKKTNRKKIAYLTALCFIALTTAASTSMAWFDINILTGAQATLIVIGIIVIALAVVYAKFFRGSATKLLSKIRSSK